MSKLIKKVKLALALVLILIIVVFLLDKFSTCKEGGKWHRELWLNQPARTTSRQRYLDRRNEMDAQIKELHSQLPEHSVDDKHHDLIGDIEGTIQEAGFPDTLEFEINVGGEETIVKPSVDSTNLPKTAKLSYNNMGGSYVDYVLSSNDRVNSSLHPSWH